LIVAKTGKPNILVLWDELVGGTLATTAEARWDIGAAGFF
jgi:hypothetical protein